MFDEREYFYCYSTNLFKFLKQEGFFYICCGLHEKTFSKFWQFKRTPEIDKALQAYRDRSKEIKADKMA